ncbi:hypothetical protein C5Y97_17035 [Blastopirellula marina]|uniref:Uncharacterized protein n=1 Tax=Blastopirellula marina TaxID=124 RepID=A0A2S8FP16_9BACT|nr:hypothetical protein C5Y98_17025 [Blastopirellula marina]PTL43709.1 hypothetical protein C5Y97_17035 [Blastopirellula marina]
MGDTCSTAANPAKFELPSTHLLCSQADMSPRPSSAYTNEWWMFAQQTNNVPIVTPPRLVNEAFLQGNAKIEINGSHMMEVDLRRRLPNVFKGLKVEYFHAFDIPKCRRCEVFVGGGRLAGP